MPVLLYCWLNIFSSLYPFRVPTQTCSKTSCVFSSTSALDLKIKLHILQLCFISVNHLFFTIRVTKELDFQGILWRVPCRHNDSTSPIMQAKSRSVESKVYTSSFILESHYRKFVLKIILWSLPSKKSDTASQRITGIYIRVSYWGKEEIPKTW